MAVISNPVKNHFLESYSNRISDFSTFFGKISRTIPFDQVDFSRHILVSFSYAPPKSSNQGIIRS